MGAVAGEGELAEEHKHLIGSFLFAIIKNMPYKAYAVDVLFQFAYNYFQEHQEAGKHLIYHPVRAMDFHL
jgi:hypothetical protein